MNSLLISKIVKTGYVSFFVGVVTIPDMILELLLALLHLLLEAMHILFEVVELSLDHLIEHLFHTDLHQTQVIVFYIIMSMLAAAAFFLWRALPRIGSYFKNLLISAYKSKKKACMDLLWKHSPFTHKHPVL